MSSYKLSYSMIVDLVKDELSLIKRGENKVDSGHILLLEFDGSLGVIRGSVKASMKNEKHQVEIHLKSDNSVDHSTCTCKRGVHPACSHRVALLLHGMKHISATDSACSWRAPKRIEPTTSSVNMIYPSRDYEPCEDLREEDRIWFREELKKLNRFTGFYWLLQDSPTLEPFPWLTVKDILQQHSSKENILNALRVSNEDIVAIADKTKGQRDNNLWFEMRFGRLTASNFGPILSAINNKRFSPSLYSKLLGSTSLDHIRSIQYGITHEGEAVEIFEKNKNVKVTQTGIWLDQTGMLGASPDGLVGQDSILEIKCPWKHRTSTDAQQLFEDKSYCFKEGELDKSHPYYHQIQGQLYISNRSLCHFLVYTPNFTIITEVQKDPDWGENLDKLKLFYSEQFLAKLMG